MKIVGLLDAVSQEPDNAYRHRVHKLLEGARARGHETSCLYLQDRGVKRPTFMRARNGKRFREELLQADVIHAANIVAAVAAGLAVGDRVPILFDVHGDVPAEARMRWTEQRSRTDLIDSLSLPYLDRKARKVATAFLVVSTPSLDDYMRFGVGRERLFLVRNGVDLEQFAASPVPTGTPIRLGYAGGMQVWQGLPLLLEGFAASAADALLRVIGFSPETEGLRNAFAGRLGGRAELFDAMPRAEMICSLRECQALVLTRPPHQAVRVAMPTKFGEFAALGRPVLVADVDETATFVREYGCGWVAEPTPEGVAAAIATVAQATPEELSAMGMNARHMAEGLFAWDLLCDQYCHALEGTLRLHRRS